MRSVAPIRSDRVVCVVQTSQIRAKAFQIGFEKDGSLYIHFPYFEHRVGLLSSSEIPATGERTAQVSLENGGMVTSHLVKYSHHADGEAHFSQDGKIFTAIRRKSVALDQQNGHIFSLLIQGLHALDAAKITKDAAGVSDKRAVIDFPVHPTYTVKFVGRWLNLEKLRGNHEDGGGPRLHLVEPGGWATESTLVANPHRNLTHVLAISCVAIPSLSSDPELFYFQGGFAPPRNND